MRIATLSPRLNRAIILAVLSGIAGCAHKAPPAPPLAPMENTTQPATEPTTDASVQAATQTTAEPATQPGVEAGSAPAVGEPAATNPAPQAGMEGMSTTPGVITPPAATTSPGTNEQAYITAPATQTASESNPQATTEAATSPATEPATQAVEIPFNPAPPSTNPIELDGDAALAERIASIAHTTIPSGKLPTPEIWPDIWKQVGALLSAANKLNPGEPRYSRLLTDAMLQLRDNDGAIQALLSTRKSDPNDEFAQVQLVDLYTNRIETADKKVNYLKDLLGRPSASENVRSHAGVMAAHLLLERGQDETARNVLAEALRLNPLNGEGLRLRYAMLPANVSSFERAEALMAILKANPAQADFAGALADQIAANGLVQESLPWYELALKLGMRQGRPDLGIAMRMASELYIAGDRQVAPALADQLIKVDPDNAANWFLKLLITRAAGNKDDYIKAMQQAMNVMSNHVVEIVNSAADKSGSDNGANKPTTRPITTEGPYPLPDLNLTISRINQSGSPELKNAFVSAVTDLATLGIYFAQDAEMSQKLIASLKSVVPDDSPTLARLQGWNYLIQGKREEAKVKLSAIAAQDPMAELGLVKLAAMDDTEKQTAASMGRKLISDYPSGLIGAMLWNGLADLGPKIVPSSQADAMKQELDRFPKDWTKIIDSPQGFYAIRVDPLSVACAYGEPLLARVTIQNLTDIDLTIGPDGVLKQDLWFNAQVKGVIEQNFVGTAYDRIAGPLVLHGRQRITQTIRLDQGPLLQLVTTEPRVALEVYGSVLTNPSPAGGGQIASGPAGYSVQFIRVFDRAASPIEGSAGRKAMDDLAGTAPRPKISAINLLNVYLQLLSSAKDPNDSMKQASNMFVNTILTARNDPVPAVSAWARYTTAMLTNPQQRATLVREMLQDPDWRRRLVGLLASETIPLDQQKEAVAALASDPEPAIRAFALARQDLVEIVSKLPSTQPASQPATMP